MPVSLPRFMLSEQRFTAFLYFFTMQNCDQLFIKTHKRQSAPNNFTREI